MTPRWRPAALRAVDTVVANSAAAIAAIVRGVDYLDGVRDSGVSISILERSWPSLVTSSMLIVGAATLLVAMAKRCHRGVYVGHGVLMVTYAGLATAAVTAIVSAGQRDGARYVGPFAFMVLYHALMAWRTQWTPLPAGVLDGRDLRR